MPARRSFFILDGHALAYRHHFALIRAPFKTSSGEVTSAVYGFTRTILDVLTKDKPDYIAVAFDDGMSGRDERYPEYKGTREKMPDDLEMQLNRIQQVVRAFNIPILMLPGYEADDLMGTVALQAEAQDIEVTIMTGDRDLLQLLTEHTRVKLAIPVAKQPDELYDVAKFREKYGLERPLQLIDLKALEGDTSDNIPGVAGIGKKTATTLLQTYPTLEEIYANIDMITGSTRTKLEAGRDSAFLSKYLATIQRDAPISIEVEKCVALEFDQKAVESVFDELEFGNSVREPLRKLFGVGASVASVAPVSVGGQMSMFDEAEIAAEEPEPTEPILPFEIVRDEDSLRRLVQTLESAPAIAFDTETDALDQMAARLVGISLAVGGDMGYYLPVGHETGDQLPLNVVMDALRPAMTNPNIPKYAHNAVFDHIIMQRHGIDVQPITIDTMVLSWVRDTFDAELGLKRLVKDKLNLNMTTIATLIGKGKNQTTMDKVAIELAAPYAAADAACTYGLVAPLNAELDALYYPEVDPLWGTVNPPTPRDVLNKIEMPLVPVLSTMQQNGILIDTRALSDMSVKLGDLLSALEAEIHGLSGGYGPFNINSPKQLNDVLFGKLGLTPAGIRKTAHGYSTAADVLETLRGDHPIIEKILEYREFSKLKSTYVDALPTLINPHTGRVHTSYSQTGAGTGRLSSNTPNLQNIPIRTEIGREVRKAFIAPPGYSLLSVDYSQVELRIMAHISQDATLLEAFEQGQDIHAATAAIINGVQLDQVTKSMRIFAKRVNFGILYGMGAFRLARDSDLTLAQAQAFINTYFEQLPGVKRYLDRAKQLARDPGFLTTLFGRRRSFPSIMQANRNGAAAAEREAINMPIQGTAADIMKMAMIRLHDELRQSSLGARMLLQVHDELVLEVPDDRVHETAALVASVMESVADLRTPLRANASVGVNWCDTRELA